MVVESIKKHTKITDDQINSTMKDLSEKIGNTSDTSQEVKKDAKEEAKEDVDNESSIDEEVNPDYHFSLHDGTVIKSIRNLIDALKEMNEDTFSEYVNENQNDFAQWLHFVKGKDVSERFEKINDLNEFIENLKKL